MSGEAVITKSGTDIENIGKYFFANRAKMVVACASEEHADQLLSLLMTELRRNKELSLCSPESLFNAARLVAGLGLELAPQLGHVYLTVRNSECVPVIGYKGMIEMARNTGMIEMIECQSVRALDTFEYEMGTSPRIRHVKHLGRDPGELVCSYAVVKLKGYSMPEIEILTLADIDKIKAMARGDSWGKWQDEMARKSVMRRLLKRLPATALGKAKEVIDADRDESYDVFGAVEQVRSAKPENSSSRLRAALGIEKKEPADHQLKSGSGTDEK